ncbi:MAG: hypothetical protein B0D92_03875 [Spirochaeta sp. LUC14_002_19_P3]|nr:MAG: hypothetical protein B0D92_03875 [Spirochaeta sp. LUC14_002_19_P3]
MILMQEEELNAEKKKVADETSKKNAQLHELSKQESKMVPNMNEDILFKFKRIIKNKSGIGIVPVKSNVCSGCHMVLPAQFVNDVRSGEKIQFCPYCSRILYWEEGGEPIVYDFDDENVGGLADLVDYEDEDL